MPATLICFMVLGVSMNIPHQEDEMEKDILHYINLARSDKGLNALELNEYESSVATEHSRNMASGKTPFGHQGMETRIKKIDKKLGPLSGAAENVAYGIMTAREVVDGWLNSPGHKKNIEGDFRLTGIGYAKGKDGTLYFTEIFTK
ncbi:MAG: CAP domain-containing protein [Chitinophagales bacterium]